VRPNRRVTARGQTTLPRKVRAALSLRPGDRLVYEVKGVTAAIRKLAPLDAARPRALQSTLSEWKSSEDAEAADEV
jgi:antitoxin PrlF